MTMDEAKSVLAMKPEELVPMALVNFHRLENAETARDNAKTENEANAATVAKIREDHDAELKKLKEEHDTALTAKDADRAALEQAHVEELVAIKQDRDAHAAKFADLESLMGLTDGGKALIAQREKAAKAERIAALEAELATLKG